MARKTRPARRRRAVSAATKRARRRTPISKRWWFRGSRVFGRHVLKPIGVAIAVDTRRAARYAAELLTEDGRAEVARRRRERTARNARRRTWSKVGRGEWMCFACGEKSTDRNASLNHNCPAKVAAISKKRPVPTGLAKVPAHAKPPQAARPQSRGARIVRANTAAERFAFIGQIEPEFSHELEQVYNDLVMGFILLGEEIGDAFVDKLAKLPLDPRALAPLEQLGQAVAELAEPARHCREVFRLLYAEQLAAADSGVVQPKNPGFFGQTG